MGAGITFLDGAMRMDLARGLPWGRKESPEAVLRLHVLGDTYF